MFIGNLVSTKLFTKYLTIRINTVKLPHRNIQVSLVGATNELGSNLALLLKQNHKITKLHLYDDDYRVKGIGMDLSHIPRGPEICSWAGEDSLSDAIQNSSLIVMVSRVPRKPGHTRQEMITANAPAVHKLCRAIANTNSKAFFAIATNPINCVVPFASALMFKYGCYNPFKILGITHIDVIRARMLIASALGINPLNVSLPVIGGHSDDTIVPLFSNVRPPIPAFDPNMADSLTRLLRKAGTDVIFHKHGKESATLAMATSIDEFVDLMVDAVNGKEVVVNSYIANTHFGSKFFSGPNYVGPCGIIKPCQTIELSDYEKFLLDSCLPHLNRDAEIGESYVRCVDKVIHRL